MNRLRFILVVALFFCAVDLAHAQTPGAPSNLTATLNSDTTITLQWTAPTTGGVPTGYVVQIGTTPGASDVLNQQIGNVTTYQIAAGTLQPGAYSVRVRALNSSGVSGASNEVTVTVACGPPTQAPTSVTWRASTTAAQITWVGITGGSAYRVEVGTATGLSDVSSTTTASGSNRNFLNVVLPGAGTYFARVKAVRSCGSPPTVEAGPASEEVTIVAATITPSTTIVINEFNTFVELKNISNGTITVGGWRIQASGGADQLVSRLATVPAGTTIAAGCTYLLAATGDSLLGAVTADQALGESVSEGVAVVRTDGMIVDAAGRLTNFGAASPNTPYLEGGGLPRRSDTTGIQSFARSGDQDTNSNTADFIPLVTANPQNAALCFANQPPAAPTNLSSVVTGAIVTLSWNAPTTGGTVLRYRLEAGTSPGASNAGLFDLGGQVTSVVFAGVPNGTFYVRLRAINNTGVSAASNEVTVIVCAAGCTAPPGPVTQLGFQVSNRNVLLTWRGPATGGTPTGYVIEAGTQPGLSDLGQFPTGSTAEFVTVSSVPPGTYYVRVRAAIGGSLGPPSNEVTIVVQ